MKKFLAMFLAFTLVMSMNVTAFAEIVQEPVDAEVSATYVPNENDVRVEYAVDIEWSNLSFTYQEGAKRWDTTKHEYVDMEGSEGRWDESKAVITVTNHSNAAVSAAPEWKASEPFANVDMVFKGADGSDINGGFPLVLESADLENKEVIGTIHVTPAGHLDESAIQTTKIGVITITINKVSDTIYVSDEEGLRAAVAEGGNIELLNMIEITQEEEIVITEDVSLNLAGYGVVSGEERDYAVFGVNAEDDSVTVRIQNGSITNSNGMGVYNQGGTLYLNDVAISALSYGAANSGGTMEVHGGEINAVEGLALHNERGGKVTSYNCNYSSQSYENHDGNSILFPTIQNVDDCTIEIYGGNLSNDAIVIAHIKMNTNEGNCTADTKVYDATITSVNVEVSRLNCAADVSSGGSLLIENCTVVGDIYKNNNAATEVIVDEITRSQWQGQLVTEE